MRFDTALADRVTAIVLFALGAAMLTGGYTMDRLEIRQIHPASIPGLVPMFLGGATMVCAVLLFAGATGRGGDASAKVATQNGKVYWTNLLVAAAMSIGYALLLVGRLPFFVATAIYVSAFIAYFAWPHDADRTRQAKCVAWAVGFGLIASGAIAALFRFGFLVRLP